MSPRFKPFKFSRTLVTLDNVSIFGLENMSQAVQPPEFHHMEDYFR
jgi:hypothetical protein